MENKFQQTTIVMKSIMKTIIIAFFLGSMSTVCSAQSPDKKIIEDQMDWEYLLTFVFCNEDGKMGEEPAWAITQKGWEKFLYHTPYGEKSHIETLTCIISYYTVGNTIYGKIEGQPAFSIYSQQGRMVIQQGLHRIRAIIIQ